MHPDHTFVLVRQSDFSNSVMLLLLLTHTRKVAKKNSCSADKIKEVTDIEVTDIEVELI